MFHSRKNLAPGRSVALEFVGHDHARHVRQAFEQLAEELLGGPLVPPTLDQDIQDVPVLIYGPPQIVMLALDPQTHLIHAPLVAWPRTAATELIGVLLPGFATPFAN